MSFLYGDGHVHLHPELDLGALLRASRTRSRAVGAPLLLLLTECAGQNVFVSLREAVHADAEPARSLGLHATDERLSLTAIDVTDGTSVHLVAGRQIVSSERVEVLALALDPDDPAGALADLEHPAATLVARLVALGAAVVLPWGFGKWIGARASVVASVLGDATLAREPRLLLGDSAHRCRPWPTPRLFLLHPRVLAGTDLLAVPGVERRLALYGFRLPGDLDPRRPAASLLAALDRGGDIEVVGERESLASTLLEQIRYRARSKRRRDSPT